MRTALVEAAELLIREEGYPAVTARTLADKVNLKRQIVHYYFHTMDDVFIAVIRQNAEKLRAQLQEATRSAEPLRALQTLNRDPEQVTLAMELAVLARRRPAVRAEVGRAAKEARELQTRALSEHLKQRNITPGMQPIVATILLTSLAQVLALEAAIDISSGHSETLEFVDGCLRAFAEGRESPFATAVKSPSKPRSRRKPLAKTARRGK
jgi:AcrR family transcriptional regulator